MERRRRTTTQVGSEVEIQQTIIQYPRSWWDCQIWEEFVPNSSKSVTDAFWMLSVSWMSGVISPEAVADFLCGFRAYTSILTFVVLVLFHIFSFPINSRMLGKLRILRWYFLIGNFPKKKFFENWLFKITPPPSMEIRFWSVIPMGNYFRLSIRLKRLSTKRTHCERRITPKEKAPYSPQ